MIGGPRRSPLFPYTTLFRSRRIERQARRDDQRATLGDREGQQTMLLEILGREPLGQRARGGGAQVGGRAGRRRRWRGRGCLDRKSTRLNSSHGYISYAVFCL